MLGLISGQLISNIIEEKQSGVYFYMLSMGMTKLTSYFANFVMIFLRLIINVTICLSLIFISLAVCNFIY